MVLTLPLPIIYIWPVFQRMIDWDEPPLYKYRDRFNSFLYVYLNFVSFMALVVTFLACIIGFILGLAILFTNDLPG